MLVETSFITDDTFISFDIGKGSLLSFAMPIYFLVIKNFLNLKLVTVESVAFSHYPQQMC